MSSQCSTQHLKSALMFEEKKQYKKALDEYKKALNLDQKNFQAWLNAGAIYSKIIKSEKAIICYIQALKQKSDERVYYNLGAEYFKLRKFTHSMEAIKMSLKQNPRFLPAYLLLAVIADQLNQFKIASDSIENLLKYDPSHRGGSYSHDCIMY